MDGTEKKSNVAGRKIIHTKKLAHYLLNSGNELIKIMSDSKNQNIILYVFDVSTKGKNSKLRSDTNAYSEFIKSNTDGIDFISIDFNEDLLFLEKYLLKKRVAYFADISRLKKLGGA